MRALGPEWKKTFENKRELTKIICEKFFNQLAIKEESSVVVKQFYNTTKECILSFKSFGINFDSCEPVIVFLLLRKLDEKSREQFENRIQRPRENPSLNDLLQFLEHRVQALQSSNKNNICNKSKTSHVISKQ